MIKAIIFDCFGVLVADALRPKADELAKTNPRIGETMYGIMRELDLGLISPDRGFTEIATVLNMTPQDVKALSQKGEVRNAPLVEQIPPLRHRYKIGLLSNVQSKHWLEDRFLPGELNELFDVVIASGDVGMVKPDPGIYQLMASRLGVEASECVMIDDRPSGVDGAIAAGMQAIHFLNNNQAMHELNTLIDNRGQTD